MTVQRSAAADHRSGDGVVYVATGERAQREVLRSMRSVRQHSPELGVTVFTDAGGLHDRLAAAADRLDVIDDPHFSERDKILPLIRRPYLRTLFLDADTIVRRPIAPLLDLCDAFDVAATHDVWRAGVPVDVPSAFVEPNTGVLVLGSRPVVDELVHDWDAAFAGQLRDESALLDRARRDEPIYSVAGTPAPRLHDQPSFRLVVWEAVRDGRLRFGTLPAEANLRLWGAASLAAGAMPWIVHTHAEDAHATAAALERTPHARAWLPGLSGGMGGRTRDELVVGGDCSRAVRVALAGLDAARAGVRRVAGFARRLGAD